MDSVNVAPPEIQAFPPGRKGGGVSETCYAVCKKTEDDDEDEKDGDECMEEGNNSSKWGKID